MRDGVLNRRDGTVGVQADGRAVDGLGDGLADVLALEDGAPSVNLAIIEIVGDENDTWSYPLGDGQADRDEERGDS